MICPPPSPVMPAATPPTRVAKAAQHSTKLADWAQQRHLRCYRQQCASSSPASSCPPAAASAELGAPATGRGREEVAWLCRLSRGASASVTGSL